MNELDCEATSSKSSADSANWEELVRGGCVVI